MNTSVIQDFLGLQGGEPIPWIGTVTLADFSETAVGELVEARGFVSQETIVTVNGDGARYSLDCRVNGGMVITEFSVDQDVPANATARPGNQFPASWNLAIAPTTTYTGEIDLSVLDVGALQAVSTFRATVNDNGIPIGLGTKLPNTYQIQPGVRWFIPSGSSLYIQSNALRSGGGGNDIVTRFTATWRELAPPTRGS